MARVPLEVTLLSAHGLDVYQEPFDRSSFQSDSTSTAAAVYAVIYLVSGCDVVHAMHRTPPDDSGAGNNPEWGFTAGFTVPLEDIHVQDLLFSLICRSAGADYTVGDVRVPVGELLIRLASDPSTGDPPWSSEFSYPVKTPWGWRRGTLCFRVRCGETLASAAAGTSLEWVATGVPTAMTSTPPLALTPAYEEAYLPDDSKFWRRRRNSDKLFAFLLAMLAAWLLLLMLLYVNLLFQVYLAGSPLRPPLPVILVYGYLERPAVPPPAAPAAGGRPRWPAILLLAGLLTIIRLPCCT